jgi:hypothetical protein
MDPLEASHGTLALGDLALVGGWSMGGVRWPKSNRTYPRRSNTPFT